MIFVILCVVTFILLLIIPLFILYNTREIKKSVKEIEELREKNLSSDDKISENCNETKEDVVEEKIKTERIIKKKKNHTQKLEGGFMNKYDNKMESLSKQLGDSYLLSLDYGKKGYINLVVYYVGNAYKIKFNSRKFNETSNATIIKKIKNEIKNAQGGNNNEQQ